MKRVVKIIHLVCPTELHVKPLGGERYSTGIWAVAERAAEEAVIIALHKTRKERSYLQGRKLSWTTERRDPGAAHEEGCCFEFQSDGDSLPWPEKTGAGEKAYTYK